MDLLRKVMLTLSVISFAVCCLFLNLMGGIALCMNNYDACGKSLILSVILFAVSLIFAFFRRLPANILSALFNAAATLFYIYPIGILNAIPNEQIPRTSIEVITSRIYPAVIVTIVLAIAVFADFFSYDRMAMRAERKRIKAAENKRELTEDEKII